MSGLVKQGVIAEMLSVSAKTMELWRREKRGPAFIRIGKRHIRYSIKDVEDWIEKQREEPGR